MADHTKLPERIAAFYESLNQGPRALSGLDELFVPEVHYISPVEEVHRLADIRDGYEKLFKDYPEIRFVDIQMMGDEHTVMGIWTMIMPPRIGPTVTIRVASRFLGRDGKVYDFRDYWDQWGSLMDAIPVVGSLYKRAMSAIFA